MFKKNLISEEQKKEFAGIYILDYMVNFNKTFPVFLDGNDVDLEPVLEWLMMNEYVIIENKEKYVVAEKGKNVLEKFMKRYLEFLKIFDVYCAVDLQEGSFAFESYFDFETEDEWKEFLADERWEDLRVAVADYKGINAIEIVFMSFINEGRFGRGANGWQFDLLLGSVWDEILLIVDSALKWQDLGYNDEEGEVSPQEVIEDIIVQGAELMVDLLKKDDQVQKQQSLNQPMEEDEDYSETIIIEEQPVVYYESYYDPLFVGPVWRTPLFY